MTLLPTKLDSPEKATAFVAFTLFSQGIWIISIEKHARISLMRSYHLFPLVIGPTSITFEPCSPFYLLFFR